MSGEIAKVVAIHENIELHYSQGGARPEIGDVVTLTQYRGNFRVWAICEARGYGAYFPFEFLQIEGEKNGNKTTVCGMA